MKQRIKVKNILEFRIDLKKIRRDNEFKKNDLTINW